MRFVEAEIDSQEFPEAVKKIDLSKPPAVLENIDTFLGAVPWTGRRTIVVSMGEHCGRRFVRLRTFNQNKTKGHWYLTKRYFTVPIECAETLGKAITTPTPIIWTLLNSFIPLRS